MGKSEEAAVGEMEEVIERGFEEMWALVTEARSGFYMELMQQEQVTRMLERKLKSSIEETTRLNDHCNRLESEILDNDTIVADMSDKAGDYKKRAQEKDEHIAAMEVRLEMAEKGRKDATEERDRLTDSLRSAEERFRSLTQKVAELDATKNTAELNLSTALSSNIDSKRQSLAADAKVEKLEAEIATWKSANSSLQEKLSRTTTESTETIQDLNVKVKLMGEKITSMRESQEERERGVFALQKENRQLQVEIRNLQRDREVKHDAMEQELKELREIARLRKEALDDAEERLRDMASLTQSLAQSKEAREAEADPASERGTRKRKLEGEDPVLVVPAEDVLLVIQKELQSKAESIEALADQYHKAIDSEASLRVELEQIRREREAALTESSACRALAEKSEKQIVSLRRRNMDLERRLLLAAEPDHPQSTPIATPQGIVTPAATPRTPSTADIRSAQKRQEELVTAIVAQRDLYRSMLLNSPFSPTAKRT